MKKILCSFLVAANLFCASIFASQTSWDYLNADQVAAKFGEANCFKAKVQDGIKVSCNYEPKAVKPDAKPTVLCVVHGTWDSAAQGYFNNEHELFKSFLKFAQEFADINQVPVQLISFGWSGENSAKARISAGKILSDIFKIYFKDNKIITLAHSHGCNVVSAASNLLGDMCIDHIINLAAPVRENVDIEFKPSNFNCLTQFYSTSDIVAAAGAVNLAKIFLMQGSIRKYARQHGKKVVNIRTQIDGKDPGHTNIKRIVPFLNLIFKKINDNYVYNHDLDLNVNISSKPKDPLIISIRQEVSFDDIFNDECISHEIFSTSDKSQEFLRQVKQEINYSKQQQLLFKILYSRNIKDKNFIISRIVSGFIADAKPKLAKISKTDLCIGGALLCAGIYVGYKAITFYQQKNQAVAAG